jgi:DNA topoisomerase 2-associated protein PAT1
MQNGMPFHNNQPGPIHPDQLMHMSEEDRAAVLAEEARRAKRNHKIQVLSKDNGLMTPQDKNFITRIQLQQLVTATGGLEEQGPEASLAEDFYYQVFSQIRAGQRQNPNQPMNLFAQTYLNQTGGRGNRRFGRGGDSHMRRMEQQVQRAVEAAKAKPKNSQLVIAGSLGKISFSNSKTPKPMLNLRRAENAAVRPRTAESVTSRKAVLKDIENVYSCLMKMEDHERRMPPPANEESSADEIQAHMDWRQAAADYNAKLWSALKVLEPIDPNSTTLHPFIAILSHPKGKKVIPRVFRQTDEQQKLTIFTMIMVHLDQLDVVRLACQASPEAPLPLAIRHDIELFVQAVLPALFSFANDAAFGIMIGLIGLITDRVNVGALACTKIGLAFLTMFISRATIVKQSGHAPEADWDQWNQLYNRLFDLLEPSLPYIFTQPIDAGDDVYVWQFLAAIGTQADPDQQQRLVIGVKDRVMEAVGTAKTLPDEVGRPRLDNVNLFMKAIGLDVELLG